MIIDIYKIKYTDFNLKFIKIGGSNIKTILKNNKSLFESMQLLIKSYLNDSNLNIELINNYYESVGEIFIQEFTSDTLISQQTSDAALQKIILAYLSHLYEDLFNLKNNNWDFINKYKNFYNYDEYLKNYGYSVELGNGKESYNIYDSLVIEVSIFNKYLKNHDTKVFLGGELYGEKWIEEVTLANFKNFSNEEIIEQTVGYFNLFRYLEEKKNVPYESYEILENKNKNNKLEYFFKNHDSDKGGFNEFIHFDCKEDLNKFIDSVKSNRKIRMFFGGKCCDGKGCRVDLYSI